MGQSYVVLSRSDTDFSDASIVAGPAVIEVGYAVRVMVEIEG